MNEENRLSSLGEKIFFDRYALKDMEKKTIVVGDMVLAEVDQKSGQRELGKVVDKKGSTLTVELRDGGVVERSIEHVDKPLERSVEELMDRVARGAANAERADQRDYWTKEFRWLLNGWKFVPGGRILAACGTDQNLTYYNCFVIPSPRDARDGIIKTLSQMSEIMSRGGGVGINLSTLRPRFAYVKGVNGRSSGAVSWGALYSFATGLIEQGGSRRGALMLILNVWHPDVVEFINAKREKGRIENANISVGITDDFMEKVKQDGEWELCFPDHSDPNYDRHWTGNLTAWKNRGGKVIVHKTVKARELWNQIIESAWASAEPGIWFIDRTAKMSNSHYYQEGDLICTNPCGEQPLPGWSVCNLGHINLSRMVKGDQVDYDLLSKVVRGSVRFLDNIIDTSPYFFPENEKQQKSERRVGLGTIGLAELLIHMKIRYGSPEAVQFIEKLYSFIAQEAYLASTEIAREKGSFSKFESDQFLNSGFVKQLPENVKRAIERNGIRNVTLLTQAPTGTVGTMIGTSTGIEPFYSWTYFRKSRLGTHEEKVSVYEEWERKNPGKSIPSFFVNAMELAPEEHVRVQAATQRWVDSAISKTCNVPSDYSVEQVRQLYELMYELGCKGGTIYRDKSRHEQVLKLKEEPAAETKMEVKAPEKPKADSMVTTLFKDEDNIPKVRPRPYRRHGVTISKVTPSGTAHITMNDDDEGRPFEMFIEIGKGGSDIKAMAEALGRLTSLVLRLSSPLSPVDRVQEIVNQVKGIGGPRSLGFGKQRIRSLPDALAQALEEQYLCVQHDEVNYTPKVQQPLMMGKSMDSKAGAQKKVTLADLCPTCGDTSFHYIEGCQTCSSCGHSEC